MMMRVINSTDKYNPPDFENEQVLKRNALPPRSYYIPNDSIVLNGTWDFCYSPNHLFAPNATREEIAATDWEKIDVPGHWQLQGYGRPHYTNVQFPFPCDPPVVPSENPTGTYFRKFRVPREWMEDSQIRLRFDGVDSAFQVYVNGQFVGYSQGSRNPAEFDVSSLIHHELDAENELLVRVYRWCDGSYIEDQDQWWLSGIFRDVHLIALPLALRIEDFFIRTILDSKYVDAVLVVDLRLVADTSAQIQLQLREKDGAVLSETNLECSKSATTMELKLPVANPKKWTAETPYLYELEISLRKNGILKQSIQHSVGFRSVEIKRGNIVVNGKPILLKGTNRHDNHALFGRAVNADVIREDLVLMKRNNINAIRCSHYPSHPALVALADELGFWVIDEADLECHGFGDAVAISLNISTRAVNYGQHGALVNPAAATFTSDNPKWKAAYVDRMEQLVERDKNHPCIFSWSLSNESFYGRNHVSMYEWAKKRDPDRLIHYEGDSDAASADMFSYMYPSIDDIISRAKAEGDDFKKPIVLCEYGHAMGNGPGALEEYQEAFRNYRRLQGGFIWEWASHGLWKADGDGDGKGYYAYGGDFGDIPNDGTFVLDGLCYSNHTPSRGLIEVKKAFEPVKVCYKGDGIDITNGYDFQDIDFLDAVWEVCSFSKSFAPNSRKLLKRGHFELPKIAPGSSRVVKLNISAVADGNTSEHCWLTVSFRLRQESLWAPAGYELAFFQHKLSRNVGRSLRSISRPTGKLRIRDDRTQCVISGPKFTIQLSKRFGMIDSWKQNGRDLIVSRQGPLLTFWRAPIDNDVPGEAPYWRRFGLHDMRTRIQSVDLTSPPSIPNTVEIQVHSSHAPPSLLWAFRTRTTIVVYPTGAISISVSLTPTGPTPETLPRVGLELSLPLLEDGKGGAKVPPTCHWFGRGPEESYKDKLLSQQVGVFTADADALHTPYEVPQENGNRTETRWVAFTDAVGERGITVSRIPVTTGAEDEGIKVLEEKGDDEAKAEGRVSDRDNQDALFDFSASRYSTAALENARHPTDLVPEDHLRIRLDFDHHGLGTAACGPGALEQYRLRCKKMAFAFLMEPVEGK